MGSGVVSLPLVGKVFQRSNTNTVNRNVMIIAKPVDVSSVIQSSVAGGAGAGPAQLGGGHDVPANIGRDFPLDADRWHIPVRRKVKSLCMFLKQMPGVGSVMLTLAWAMSGT